LDKTGKRQLNLFGKPIYTRTSLLKFVYYHHHQEEETVTKTEVLSYSGAGNRHYSHQR